MSNQIPGTLEVGGNNDGAWLLSPMYGPPLQIPATNGAPEIRSPGSLLGLPFVEGLAQYRWFGGPIVGISFELISPQAHSLLTAIDRHIQIGPYRIEVLARDNQHGRLVGICWEWDEDWKYEDWQ